MSQPFQDRTKWDKDWPWDGDPTACWLLRVRVPVPQIDYVCRLVEAFEDMAIVRTENGASDILQLWIPIGQKSDAEAFLDQLQHEVPIERLGEGRFLTMDWLNSESW